MDINQNDDLIDELLDNDSFIQWVVAPTEELNNYWAQKIRINPKLEDLMYSLKQTLETVKVKELDMSLVEKAELWSKIQKQTRKSKSRNILKTYWIKVASVAAILLLGAMFFYNWFDQGDEINYSNLIVSDISTQTNGGVRLVLPGKREISIDSENPELVYNDKGEVNVNSNLIESKSLTEDKERTISQVSHLIVPYGKTSFLKLSDGTKIWVNSGSQVIYPTTFNASKREIYVEGEIYIEVMPNKGQSFIVKTPQMNINVLGTSFNVSAYKDEKIQSIVLVSGYVEVNNKDLGKSTNLNPNQMLSYDKSTEHLSLDKVDTQNYISWINGFLIINKESLYDVLQKLKRHYNISVSCDSGNLKDIYVSGKLDLKDNISDVLNNISLTTPIRYSLKENTITIEIKK